MSLTRKGQTGWVLSTAGTLSTDRYGLSSAIATYSRYDFGLGDPGLPVSFGSTHPVWTYLECDKVQVSHNGTHWEARADFFGVTGAPAPIYELDMSLSEEPIETHPDFFMVLGGSVNLPYNGAIFDEDGTFKGFVKDGDNDEFVGVRSYLSPGAVWRKVYVSKTKPSDMSLLGKIDVPEGSPPTVSSGRNWLYSSLSWEQRGLTYQIRKEWRLSGRQGWNISIYG